MTLDFLVINTFDTKTLGIADISIYDTNPPKGILILNRNADDVDPGIKPESRVWWSSNLRPVEGQLTVEYTPVLRITA